MPAGAKEALQRKQPDIFSHPDFNCRYWKHSNSALVALADSTADREFHPALKTYAIYLYALYYYFFFCSTMSARGARQDFHLTCGIFYNTKRLSISDKNDTKEGGRVSPDTCFKRSARDSI